MTVTLTGFDAVVMDVAKKGLGAIDASLSDRVRLGMAVVAGLGGEREVMLDDALHAVAKTHDLMSQTGHLGMPASAICDGLRVMNSIGKPAHASGIKEQLMEAMLGNLTTLEVRGEKTVFIEWRSGLPENFADRALKLWEAGRPCSDCNARHGEGGNSLCKE